MSFVKRGGGFGVRRSAARPWTGTVCRTGSCRTGTTLWVPRSPSMRDEGLKALQQQRQQQLQPFPLFVRQVFAIQSEIDPLRRSIVSTGSRRV